MINTLLPIMILFFYFALREIISVDLSGKIRKKMVYLLTILSIYAFFASVSIFINEEGFDSIKRYLIYIYSPIIIFVSILGLHLFKRNNNIRAILNILLIFGIAFSVYAFVVEYVTCSIKDMGPLETNRGIWIVHGGGYGVGNVGVSERFRIPGMTSIETGPMMALMVLVGIYFIKISLGVKKYLYFIGVLFLSSCVLLTVSRGSLLMLTAGLIYFMLYRWFKPKQILFIIGIAVCTVFSFAKVLFYRLVITAAIFFPIDLQFISSSAQSLTHDPRLMYWGEVLSYLYRHFFFGMGMRNFLETLGYGKMHSNYMVVPTAFGVPAGLFYIIFIILLFKMVHTRMKRLAANQAGRNLGTVLSAGMLALMVYLLGGPTDFHFIWVWFGLSAAWLRNSMRGVSQKQVF